MVIEKHINLNIVLQIFKQKIVRQKNRAVGSTLGNPHDHFKVAESNTAASDKYYPDRMQFKWKEIDLRNGTITDVAK